MAMSEELSKLDELHRRGSLTDDEFSRAKARVLSGEGAGMDRPAAPAINALRRSRSDRWIAGVCGGMARATAIDSWVWRLLFVVLLIFGGVGLLLYLLLWLVVPAE